MGRAATSRKLLVLATGSATPAAAGRFLEVNCSGLPFAAALQATVAQGLLNRGQHPPRVWLSDIGEGLGSAGQKDGAGFPGGKFIEWKTGHAGGPWCEPLSVCRTCGGLRARWLATAAAAAGQQPAPTTFAALMAAAKPLLAGKAFYAMDELHALGPLVTMAGIDGVLPVTNEHDPIPGLNVLLDTRGMWADATVATVFTTENLLHKTNTSVFAVQAPTCMPFLVDAIVDYKMACFWMQDLCNASSPEHAAMEALVETSGHFDTAVSKGGLYYMGWFNHTHEPNPELLEECTLKHSLITLASAQSDNLSFLNKLGVTPGSLPFKQPPLWAGGRTKTYSASKAYVSIIVSDGDNIAEDWSTLRPTLEERVQSKSKVPLSWTISNRWLQWGPAVLEWAYAQAAATTTDSFLMGPSGCMTPQHPQHPHVASILLCYQI